MQTSMVAVVLGTVLSFAACTATDRNRASAKEPDGTASGAGKTWTPKRLSDGQPDVQGYWRATGPAGAWGLNIEPLPNMMGDKGKVSAGLVVDPPDGRIPYLPWARARRDEVADHYLHPNHAQVDTRNRGWPDGAPRLTYYGLNPVQIIQPPGWVVILYEAQHEFRAIPLDGRPQPGAGVKLWMGSSRGHWEGNTLVVNIANLTDRIRLSLVGDFHSDAVKVTERWTFDDADTLHLASTLEDPNVYSRPWTFSNIFGRIQDQGFELMEYAGVEEDKDTALMVDIPAALKKK